MPPRNYYDFSEGEDGWIRVSRSRGNRDSRFNRNRSNSYRRRNRSRSFSRGPTWRYNNYNSNQNHPRWKSRSRSNRRQFSNVAFNRPFNRSWSRKRSGPVYRNQQSNNNNHYNNNNNYNNKGRYNNKNNNNKNRTNMHNNNGNGYRRPQSNHNNNGNNNHSSTNPDFACCVKTCFKIWSTTEQIRNWENTPNSIAKGFEELGNSINPVNPSDIFRTHVKDILRETMRHVNQAVNRHLTDSLEVLNRDITKMNPLDKHLIIETVKRQIRRKRPRGLDHAKLDRDMAILQQRIGSAIPNLTLLSSSTTRSDQPTNLDRDNIQLLAAMATPNRSPTERLYSDVTRTGQQKRPRVDSTPPNMQQQVRIVTPTSITIPAVGESIQRRTGVMKISNAKDKASWKVSVQPNTSCLIIGSSNFRCIEPHMVPEGVQLEVFPGNRFEHMIGVISTLTNTPNLQKIVIDCGLNNRSHHFIEDGTANDMEDLEAMLRNRTEEIYTLGVQINPDWSDADKNNVQLINARLEEGMAHSVFIDPLPTEEVTFKGDGHHYTAHSMEKIWNKILESVKN